MHHKNDNPFILAYWCTAELDKILCENGWGCGAGIILGQWMWHVEMKCIKGKGIYAEHEET